MLGAKMHLFINGRGNPPPMGDTSEAVTPTAYGLQVAPSLAITERGR